MKLKNEIKSDPNEYVWGSVFIYLRIMTTLPSKFKWCRKEIVTRAFITGITWIGNFINFNVLDNNIMNINLLW